MTQKKKMSTKNKQKKSSSFVFGIPKWKNNKNRRSKKNERKGKRFQFLFFFWQTTAESEINLGDHKAVLKIEEKYAIKCVVKEEKEEKKNWNELTVIEREVKSDEIKQI